LHTKKQYALFSKYLASIEGMGIMFTKMTALPATTAKDHKSVAMQDPTAPPAAGPTGMILPAMSGGLRQPEVEIPTHTIQN